MKHTTASRDPGAFNRLRALVRDIEIAMVTTVTPDGALHSRPMATREFNEDGEIWFLSADDSAKAGDLAAEHGVNLSYADPRKHAFISVTGNAEIVHDRDRASRLWHSNLKSWFPQGLDDPHLALIRVRVETAEYWDSTHGKMLQLFHHLTGNGDSDAEHTQVDIRATPASG